MATAWARNAGMIGRLERIGEPFPHRAGDDTVVETPLYFEAADAVGIVRFDPAGKVAGLAIRPAPANSQPRLSQEGLPVSQWSREGSPGALDPDSAAYPVRSSAAKGPDTGQGGGSRSRRRSDSEVR
jgi:hypothetical protein